MKNDIVNNVRLDINRQKNKAAIYVRVGDTKSRTVHFTIVDKGTVVNLDDLMIALITIIKPDGNKCYNDLVRQDNELHYTLTSQSINVPGECTCEIELGFLDGSSVIVPGFSIMAYEKYLSDKFIESTNEYKGVTAQILLAKEHAEAAEASATQCAENEKNVKASEEVALSYKKSTESLLEEFREEKTENDIFIMESLEAITGDREEVANNALITQQNAEYVAGLTKNVSSNAVAVNQKAEEILSDTNLAKGYAEAAEASAEQCANDKKSATEILENTEGNKQEIESILSEVTELQKKCQTLADKCTELYNNFLSKELLELGTTHTTAYYGDLGQIAYKHSQMTGNPHVTTYQDVGADAAGSAQTVYENAVAYTDQAIANLINGAPGTLDTLREIADAMTEHVEVVEALEAAIGSKADVTEVNSLINQLDERIDALEDSNGYPIG